MAAQVRQMKNRKGKPMRLARLCFPLMAIP